MARISPALLALCTAAALAACGRPQPEPVVVVAPPAPAPIYGKDGTIIEQPVVSNQNAAVPGDAVLVEEPVESVPVN